MSTPLQLKILNADGSNNTTVAPTFAAWVDKAGAAQTPGNATWVHTADGVWRNVPTDADQTAGRAYVIDTGGRAPAFASGALYAPADPFVAALWSNPDGQGPYTGSLLGSISTYKNPAGTDQTAPSLVTCGYSGHTKCLALVIPSSGDKAGGIVGELSPPADAMASPWPFSLRAETGSTVAPGGGNFVPAQGPGLNPMDPIQFDVTVSDGTAIALCTLSVKYAGLDGSEAIYDGAVFEPLFAASTVNAITNGLRFVIRRRGGWPAAGVILKPRAVSSTGIVIAS